MKYVPLGIGPSVTGMITRRKRRGGGDADDTFCFLHIFFLWRLADKIHLVLNLFTPHRSASHLMDFRGSAWPWSKGTTLILERQDFSMSSLISQSPTWSAPILAFFSPLWSHLLVAPQASLISRRYLIHSSLRAFAPAVPSTCLPWGTLPQDICMDAPWPFFFFVFIQMSLFRCLPLPSYLKSQPLPMLTIPPFCFIFLLSI